MGTNWLHQQWENATDALGNKLWDASVSVGKAFGYSELDVANAAVDFDDKTNIGEIASAHQNKFGKITESVDDSASSAFQKVSEIPQKVSDYFNPFKRLENFFEGLIDKVAGFFKDTVVSIMGKETEMAQNFSTQMDAFIEKDIIADLSAPKTDMAPAPS